MTIIPTLAKELKYIQLWENQNDYLLIRIMLYKLYKLFPSHDSCCFENFIVFLDHQEIKMQLLIFKFYETATVVSNIMSLHRLLLSNMNFANKVIVTSA